MADSDVSDSQDQAAPPDGPTGLIDGIDAVLALALIVICGIFYWLSSDFPVPGLFLGDNVLPEQFPRMLLVTIGIFCSTHSIPTWDGHLSCIKFFIHLRFFLFLDAKQWIIKFFNDEFFETSF